MNLKQYPITELSCNAIDDASIDIEANSIPSEKVDYVDIENVKSKAFKDGYNSALASIEAEALEKTSKIIEIQNKIDDSLKLLNNNNRDVIEQIIDLSLAIAKKIVGSFLDHHAKKSIEDFLHESLPTLYDCSRLTIKVNIDLVDEVQNLIKIYDNFKIQILGDAKILLGDCEIEFHGNKISKNRQTILNQIESLLHNDNLKI